MRVYDGVPSPATGGADGPVYASRSGDPAVPTGTVLVRFGPAVRAEDRCADLEAAGFTVESVPVWAPNAAWVRAAGGGIAAALRGLARLRRLPGVEAVEPEVLLARGKR